MAALSLQSVEALAPDQASLKAAGKLVKPAKWPLLGQDPATGLFWGECQGSGANPYRVVGDRGDLGCKCSCPSRKFPCKHALALMWLFVEDPGAFAQAPPPEWVGDWVARRRKTPAPAGAASGGSGGGKDLGAARLGAAPPPEAVDPKQEAKRRAAAQKRRADTRRAIAAGLEELDLWIADQLRLGLAGFLDAATERCRKIAARLVDAKAAALAGRVDELPPRLLALPREERLDAAMIELAKLTLLARAWRARPDAPAVARAVASSETRDAVAGDPEAPRAEGVWEVLAERVTTRRDGLVAQATWLLRLEADAPPAGPGFALLLDYHPAQTGFRGGAFRPGERFWAEIAFYPSEVPLRAVIVRRDPSAAHGEARWPEAVEGPLAAHRARLTLEPWALSTPVLLPPGRLSQVGRAGWWRADDGAAALPLKGAAPLFGLGLELEAAVGLWSGARCDLLAARARGAGGVAFDG